MTVKTESTGAGAGLVDAIAGKEPIDDDLRELLETVRPVFMGLKRGGPIPAPLEKPFEEAALGPRHVAPLMSVTLAGSLSVSELAAQLGLSLSTTSLMVGELNRAGLLERAECEDDRRRTIVRVNDQYTKQLGEWLAERMEPFRRTLDRLSPRERAGFLEGWRILAEETAKIGCAPAEPDAS
ncbi:MAG: MarR family winged helix-turn-helix transcriptional regulator [Thermoleophilaceae bacterium]